MFDCGALRLRRAAELTAHTRTLIADSDLCLLLSGAAFHVVLGSRLSNNYSTRKLVVYDEAKSS